MAARVARTCIKMGVVPVFGVSEADAHAPYVSMGEHVLLGPSRSANSYLDQTRVVQAAVQSNCTALHPGWGFLAENPSFASLCESHGVTFVGPPAHVMSLMGKKTPAKAAMRKTGMTLIDGSEGIVANIDEATKVCESIGYPILIKAESGGGGRGMRIARSASELQGAFNEASAEAQACFGDERVYIEKLVEKGRHIEIQLMADKYGNVVHFGERDCTVQRNHQKLVEESPAPGLDPEERARTLEAAVRATRDIGYVGAGTMEFLLDPNGVLRFMEMNTRLQVEHCVSEERSGFDLVQEQLRVAAGHRLSVTQEEITLRGHAIECRINAEDPNENFRPSPGVLTSFSPPNGEGVRVDTHVASGYEVPPFYDSLICKVITHGQDRAQAIKRMLEALEGLECSGVKTTIGMHKKILASSDFQNNTYDTSAIPGFPHV